MTTYLTSNRALHSFPTRRSSDLPLRLGLVRVIPRQHETVALNDGIRAQLRFAIRALAVGDVRARAVAVVAPAVERALQLDRKSTRLNSSHMSISYAVFCLKKKKN